MEKYDVFISCKSEDYPYAEKIYDFLKSNGISAFLASRELRRLGESEYRRAISKAMKGAEHVIVFASKAEYIDSTWVYYEWDMFVNAKLKGFKPGNIVTILKGVRTDDINMDLWKYESLTFENYQETILNYVSTEESRRRLRDIEAKRREAEEQKRRDEERKQKLAVMRTQLTEMAEKYSKDLSALAVDAGKIYNLMGELGITTRTCAVCGKSYPVRKSCCPECAWPTGMFDGIEGFEYLSKTDADAKAKYGQIFGLSKKDNTDEIEKLRQENAEFQARLKEESDGKIKELLRRQETEIKAYEAREHSLIMDKARLKEDVSRLQEEKKLLDGKFKSVQQENSSLNAKVAAKESEFRRIEAERKRLSEDFSNIEYEYKVLKETCINLKEEISSHKAQSVFGGLSSTISSTTVSQTHSSSDRNWYVHIYPPIIHPQEIGKILGRFFKINTAEAIRLIIKEQTKPSIRMNIGLDYNDAQELVSLIKRIGVKANCYYNP